MTRTAKVNLTDSELVSYSKEHLAYEIQMFFATAQILSRMVLSNSPSELEVIANNVYTESFVIHLRNLIEFLYPQRVKENSVIAEDFFADPMDWKRIRPKMSNPLKDARERSHRELAHLTTDRLKVTPATKRWPFISLAKEIKDLIERFGSSAASIRLDPSVNKLITSIDPTKFPFTVTDPSTRSL